ncbi:MAG TPA: choice-of-anchor D domain-containing protein [Candidatus Binatus sp.]|nr:choice-of-anchor D domain-containing protein [Candidatus Binatus sp.]
MRPFRAFLLSFFAVLVFTFSAAAQQDQINTVVGGGPNDMPALDADIYEPYQIAVDSMGNYYFASYGQNRVFKVNASGLLTVVAGNGLAGYSGDGVTGGAAQAMLDSPWGVAVDSNGNVYIADTYNQVIRKVDTTNTITTVAGIAGSAGYNGNGSPATSFNLYYPEQLAVDSSNNLFIADSSDALIRKLTVSSNTISTVAGNTTVGYAYCTNGTTATSCGFSNTPSVAVDSSDDIFLTDDSACVVYEVVNSTGKIKTIAGDNALGCGYNNDNITATSAQIYPSAYGQLAVNSAGTQVWLADFYNVEIRLINVGAKITAVAGQEATCGGSISGYGGPAISACIGYPIGIALDNVSNSAGDLFVTAGYYYYNNATTVSEIACDVSGDTCTPPSGDTAGDIYTVAGNGSTNDATPVNGVPALGVTLYYPGGVYQDPTAANMFISDTDNCLVRDLTSGDVNIFAGNVAGGCGYGGDGGPATSTEVNYPAGVSRDYSGNIYFADTNNQIIREVDTAGNISTFAGTPSAYSYGGDGGPATSAYLASPEDVFVDSYGNVIIADYANHRIREVVCATTPTPPYSCTPPAGETAGYIYTVAGNGTAAYAGDGGPATSAELYYPYSASTDSAGNLYIADTYNQRIREVNPATGIINTIAGNGDCGFSGDGPALENTVCYPEGLRADLNGNVFFADSSNERIRWVDGGGSLTTFAGTAAGFSGDGGPAIDAELYQPNAVFEDASGDFFISDSYNFRIREIGAFAAVGRSTGSIVFGEQPKGIQSYPFAVTLSGIGPAVIDSLTASGDFSEVDDCVGNLPNGTNCTVSVYFTPTASGARYGTLTVNTNGYFSTTTTISLRGTGTGLTITPNPLAFGSDVDGTAVIKTITVKGATTYYSVALEGDTTDFTYNMSTSTCKGAVTSSCTISITFDPTTIGAKKATLVITDSDPTSPQVVSVTGTGTSYESFTPTSVTFATVEVVNTTSKATKVTFKYTGSSTLTLTALTPSTGFVVNETGITSDACNPGTTMLAKNGLCYFNVEFAPGNTIGTVTGNVTATFTGDPGNSSLQLPLTGNSTEVSISPASMAFGTVSGPAGTLKKETSTITNKGTTPLTFNGTPTIAGTGSAQFTVLPYVASPAQSTCLSGNAVAQNGTCTITVQFTSTDTGTSYSETMSISDNGGASPQVVKITAKD